MEAETSAVKGFTLNFSMRNASLVCIDGFEVCASVGSAQGSGNLKNYILSVSIRLPLVAFILGKYGDHEKSCILQQITC